MFFQLGYSKMCGCYLRSCVHIIIHVLFIYFNILPFLFVVFLVVWSFTTLKRTDPISFVSTSSLLHFAIIYIRSWIRIRSLSAPFWIRQKHMVEGMVKTKSDLIRSVYFPSYWATQICVDVTLGYHFCSLYSWLYGYLLLLNVPIWLVLFPLQVCSISADSNYHPCMIHTRSDQLPILPPLPFWHPIF
jgi:hypothetical protein